MWKLRTLVVSGVLTAIMVVGLAVAYAGWSWNTEIDVEGVPTHVNWTVIDDQANPQNYLANIVFKLPKKATVNSVQVNTNETVTIKHVKKLKCKSNGIQSKSIVTVNPANSSAVGMIALVTVYAGDNNLLGQGVGMLGSKIKVNGLIPATCTG